MGGNLQPVFMFFISFFFIFFVADVGLSSQLDDCSQPMPCKPNGPHVQFPFRLKGVQPDHCGYPGFDLSCSDDANETVLHLPFSEPFFVKAINYTSQTIDLYDPSGCTPQRLLHFNTSNSPFLYEQYAMFSAQLFNVSFFTCSSVYGKFITIYQIYQIDCLGVPGSNQVFAAFERSDCCNENSLDCCLSMEDLPVSYCTKLKTVPYVEMGDLDPEKQEWGIRLSWVAPGCRHCELQGKGCRLKDKTGTVRECFDPVPPAKKGAPKKLIIGITLGFSGLVLIILIAVKLYRMHNLDKIEQECQLRIKKFLEDYKALKPTRYSYADLKRITNQFTHALGQGGYGNVFKGKLSNEIEVAVKILNDTQGNGEEFINEVSTIGTIHHVNIVRLVGFCADGYRRALVYEFMPNESLEKYIFSRNKGKNPFLGWKKLLDIAIGIAKGIEYLHQGCDQRILHFDIKPHNVLLDENFNPKITDFGLAKLCLKGESIVSMSVARGTIGYIAPEVLSRNFGNVSYKSDVYSFGMLLLEMVGGRKNTDATVSNDSQVYFPEWAYKCLDQGRELEIIEKDGDEDQEVAKKLTIVALWCIQWCPIDRPSMKAVVQMLEGEVESLIMPPNPFASSGQPLQSSATNPGRNAHDNVLTIIPEEDEHD